MTSPTGVACQAHRPPELESRIRRLRGVLVLTAVFMVAELVGGVVANSLALLADAGHMFTDVAAIGLAMFVAWIAQRPATPQKTYGYVRLEIFAALINGSALFLIAGAIVWEAVGRFRAPEPVVPGVLIGVASAGLVANLVAMRILHHGHEHSLNLRGAYLHVISDLLGSVGAVVAGVVILLTGWMVVDPIISVGVAGLILVSAWRLVREAADVLMESVPRGIELEEVEQALATVPHVEGVHDLHVWSVTSGVVAMSGHVVVEDTAHHDQVLATTRRRLDDLGIHHVTIQIERSEACQDVLG